MTMQYFRTLFLKGPADITGGCRGRPGAGSSHAGQGERKNKEWNKLCGFTVVINQFHQPKQRQRLGHSCNHGSPRRKEMLCPGGHFGERCLRDRYMKHV